MGRKLSLRFDWTQFQLHNYNEIIYNPLYSEVHTCHWNTLKLLKRNKLTHEILIHISGVV